MTFFIQNIIHWFRQLFCKHDFEIFKEGKLKKSFDIHLSIYYSDKPTWTHVGYWRTYICKKCLYKKDIETN